jgi:hypothetical protein
VEGLRKTGKNLWIVGSPAEIRAFPNTTPQNSNCSNALGHFSSSFARLGAGSARLSDFNGPHWILSRLLAKRKFSGLPTVKLLNPS